MIRSLWTSATGMHAQAKNIDVISNNLANVNTVGFKRSRAEFQDLVYENVKAPGAPSSADSTVPTGVQIGHGVRTVATHKLFTQGDVSHTGNQLDLAIEGDGFFQITQPNGDNAYTRSGNFKLDSEGRIVTVDGFALEPEITVPVDATSISVGSDGTVAVILAGESEASEIGSIQLAQFVNPAGLSSIGRNMYSQTDATGDPTEGTPGEDGLGTISQGYLEMSNVKVVEEMVNMVAAQRAYEVNAKAIQATDEMLQMVNGMKR